MNPCEQAIGPGHNRGPADEIADLFQRAADLVRNANRWREERPKITDAEMAGAASRFAQQLREVRDDLKARLDAEREPLDAALDAVKTRYAEPLALIDVALNGIVTLSTDWLRRERDRLDAERRRHEAEANEAIAEATRLSEAANKPGASVEAELAARRAEEKAAELTDVAASFPTRPQVRDEQTARAQSLRANWKARIINEDAALKSYRNDPRVRKAALAEIAKVATREAKLQKDPSRAKSGIEYFNDEKAQ